MPPIDVEQSLDNLKLERDAIVLYDALAAVEKDPRRADAFRPRSAAMPEGAVSASLGYSFVNTEFDRVVSGGELGGTNGTSLSLQGNYWGNGENSMQAIGSYGFQSEYYWTRLRAAHRLAPSANPIYLGGEIVVQGNQKGYRVGTAGLRTASQMRYEVGPTLEYRVSPEFRVGGSAGYRGGNNSTPGSGYVRVEFLVLTKLGGM